MMMTIMAASSAVLCKLAVRSFVLQKGKPSLEHPNTSE